MTFYLIKVILCILLAIIFKINSYGVNRIQNDHVSEKSEARLFNGLNFKGLPKQRLSANKKINVHQSKGLHLSSTLRIFNPTLIKAVNKKPVQAKTPNYKDKAIINIKYIDVNQGLSSSYVWNTHQDSRGFLWFGTYGGGLIKYDGKQYMNFTKSEGINSNFIMDIFEDTNQNMWLATHNGITVYDGNKFSNFNYDNGFVSEYVWEIIKDKKENIWFCTSNGLLKYNTDEKDIFSFSHFTVENGLSSNIINAILEDQRGNIWIGTASGLELINDDMIYSFTIGNISDDWNVKELFQDSKRNIWIGTTTGILIYDGTDFMKPIGNPVLEKATISSIVEDGNGNIWIGTNEGVFRYDGNYITHLTEDVGLSSKNIKNIFIDSDDNLWFATYGGGVNKYEGNNFFHNTIEQGLPTNKIYSIYQDSKDNFWFGTDNNGIGKFDGNSLDLYSENDGLAGNSVWSIKEDSSGNIWIGTYGGGLSKYDGKSFKNFTVDNGLISNNIRTIEIDKFQNIWIATKESGLTKFNIEKEIFTYYTETDGFLNTGLWSIYEDSKGIIWLGTSGRGVCRFDGKQFSYIDSIQGLNDPYVKSIFEDSNENMWFGTNNGIFRYFENTGELEHFSVKDGISNNIIWSIAEDDNNNIWIGTENGLNRMKPSINDQGLSYYQISIYGIEDGLKGLDFCLNSVLIDKDNYIWWGTGKSLINLNLSQNNRIENPPQIYLSGIDIGQSFIDYNQYENSIYSDSSSTKKRDTITSVPFFNYPYSLVLPNNVNHLTFYYSGLNWRAPHKINFTYKIEGLDSEWSQLTIDNHAEYRNIPHGKYLFKVKAVNENGIWTKTMEYPFTIETAWWQTIWAKSFLGFFIILTFTGIYKRRTYILKNQKNVLKNLVRKRTIELENTNKEILQKNKELKEALDNIESTQKFLIQAEKMASIGILSNGVAHEINNPLNHIQGGIYGISDHMKHNKKINKEELYPYIESVKEGVNRASSIVKSLSQFSSSNNSNEECNIHEIINNCLEILANKIRSKIMIEKIFTKEPFIFIGNQGSLHQVIMNILSNSEQSIDKIGVIKIITEVEDNMLEITVVDTGSGIDPKYLGKVFDPFFTTKDPGEGTGLGLYIAHNIVNEHKGKFEIISDIGKGTSVTMKFPLVFG